MKYGEATVAVVLHVQEITSPDEIIHLEKLPIGEYFLRLEKDGKATAIKVVKD